MRILKTFYMIVGVDSDNPNDSWLIELCDEGVNGTKNYAFAQIFHTEEEATECLDWLKTNYADALSKIINIDTAIVKPFNLTF